jgi:hypothetical protein
MPSKSQIY